MEQFESGNNSKILQEMRHLWDDMDEEAADDVLPQPMESDDEMDHFDDIHADD